MSAVSSLAVIRALPGCSSDDEPTELPGRRPTSQPTPPAPTDDDELVPGSPPKDVPVEEGQPVNAEWDAKARALVAANVGGVAYTATSPGPFAGKERAHVPQLTIQPDGVAIILVNHVMEPGTITADAGDAGRDAGRDASRDAGDAGSVAKHFVTTIFAKDDKGHVVFLKELQATDPAPPFVAFRIPAGTKTLRACEHCNLHGVWASADAKV